MFVKVLAPATMETDLWHKQGCLKGLPAHILLPAAALQPCVELLCAHTAMLAALNLFFTNMCIYICIPSFFTWDIVWGFKILRDFWAGSASATSSAHVQARAGSFPQGNCIPVRDMLTSPLTREALLSGIQNIGRWLPGNEGHRTAVAL